MRIPSCECVCVYLCLALYSKCISFAFGWRREDEIGFLGWKDYVFICPPFKSFHLSSTEFADACRSVFLREGCVVRWIAADVCGSCLLSSKCQIFAISLGFPCPSNPADRVVIAPSLLSAHCCDTLAPWLLWPLTVWFCRWRFCYCVDFQRQNTCDPRVWRRGLVCRSLTFMSSSCWRLNKLRAEGYSGKFRNNEYVFLSCTVCDDSINKTDAN